MFFHILLRFLSRALTLLLVDHQIFLQTILQMLLQMLDQTFIIWIFPFTHALSMQKRDLTNALISA